jgi:hypothetical protein
MTNHERTLFERSDKERARVAKLKRDAASGGGRSRPTPKTKPRSVYLGWKAERRKSRAGVEYTTYRQLG